MGRSPSISTLLNDAPTGGPNVISYIFLNTLKPAFTLLKRGRRGTLHKAKTNRLPVCFSESCLRLNNRKDPYLFRDTIFELSQSLGMEYKELTSSTRGAF